MTPVNVFWFRRNLRLHDNAGLLIWREFYQMILWQFPHVGRGQSFKPAYDFIEWRYSEADFENWCQAKGVIRW
jgi:deoxyribodipyrimidine photolyase